MSGLLLCEADSAHPPVRLILPERLSRFPQGLCLSVVVQDLSGRGPIIPQHPLSVRKQRILLILPVMGICQLLSYNLKGDPIRDGMVNAEQNDALFFGKKQARCLKKTFPLTNGLQETVCKPFLYSIGQHPDILIVNDRLARLVKYLAEPALLILHERRPQSRMVPDKVFHAA